MKKEDVMQALKIDAKALEVALKEGETRQLSTIESRKRFRDGDEFERLRKTLPEVADELTSEDGKSVKVFEDYRIKDDKPVRVLYCNAIVDAVSKRWMLHNRTFGLKCIISLSSHSACEKAGLEVSKLKVVHSSSSGKSVICDVV